MISTGRTDFHCVAESMVYNVKENPSLNTSTLVLNLLLLAGLYIHLFCCLVMFFPLSSNLDGINGYTYFHLFPPTFSLGSFLKMYSRKSLSLSMEQPEGRYIETHHPALLTGLEHHGLMTSDDVRSFTDGVFLIILHQKLRFIYPTIVNPLSGHGSCILS